MIFGPTKPGIGWKVACRRFDELRQEFGLEIPNHDLETLQLHCSLAWTMSTLRLPKDPQEWWFCGPKQGVALSFITSIPTHNL